MPLDYVLKRVGFFLIIVWLAATLNFFIPRLSSQNPIRERLIEQAVLGGYVQQGMEEMVEEYETALRAGPAALACSTSATSSDLSRGDFNYSIANYPRTVSEILAEALPWTIGLLSVTTILSFVLGTLLGALMGWPRAPAFLKYVLPPLLALHALPFYLFGLVLMYFLSFRLGWLPIFGAYTAGTAVTLSVPFILDVLQHAHLAGAVDHPGTQIGGWALTMRAMVDHRPGRGLHHLRRCQGPEGERRFSCATPSGTRCCRRPRRSPWRSARSSLAVCWWRSSSGTRASGRCCSRRSARRTGS